MKTTPVRRLLGGVVLGLLAPTLCAAAVSSVGAASVRTTVDRVTEFRSDPRDNQPFQTTGGNFALGTASSRVSSSVSGGAVLAQSTVTAVAGQPRLLLITDNSSSDPFSGSHSFAEGAAMVTFSGRVNGAAAADGWLALSGLMLATVVPGAVLPGRSSGARVDLHTSVQLSRPGGCPSADCLARASVNQGFDNGAFPVYDGSDGLLGVPYDFRLAVKAGDNFVLSFAIGATAANGYAVAIGNALDRTVPSAALSAPVGRGLDETSMLAVYDQRYGDLFGRLTLSPGLSLSADSGLVLRADGSWAPAVSPVPEIPTVLMLAAGLLLLGGRLKGRSGSACDDSAYDCSAYSPR